MGFLDSVPGKVMMDKAKQETGIGVEPPKPQKPSGPKPGEQSEGQYFEDLGGSRRRAAAGNITTRRQSLLGG